MAEAHAETAAAPPARGKKKLIWIILCTVSIVLGAITPLALGAHKLLGLSDSPKKEQTERESESIAFGDVAVNLSDGRMNRYLRLKIVIRADADDSKEITKLVEKRKPVMKDWLISHLSGKTLKDISGTVGVKRVQREIQERFEELLYPHGDGKPFEILFEEFVVQ